MVWRDNIKILGLQTKALPLIISAAMHIAVLFAFSAANHNREKAFTVDVVFQDLRDSLKSDTRVIKSEGDKGLVKKTVVSSRTDIETKDQSELVQKTDELSHSSITQHASSDFGTAGKVTGGEEKGNSSMGNVIKNSGNDLVEGEFGSINGPSFLRMIKPDYPRLAKRLGKEGKVVLRLFIDEHGRLLKVETVEKAGHGFDEAAVDAVKASTFRPAKVNGHPVACKAALPVRFKLE